MEVNNADSFTKTREQLKQTFVTGAVPTQLDYADVFDSFVHKEDIIPDSPNGGVGHGDEISPLEQYLIASHAHQTGIIGEGAVELNIKRLPMPFLGDLTLQNTSDGSGDTVLPRNFIFHRGVFYDTCKEGKVMRPMFARHNIWNNSRVAINLDGTEYEICFESGYGSPELTIDLANYHSNDTDIELCDGVFVNVSVSNSGGTGVFCVYTEKPGQHYVQMEYRDSVGTTEQMQLIMDRGFYDYTAPSGDDWGTDSELGGWRFGAGQVGSLYIRLTNDYHKETRGLGYYKAECFLVNDPYSELEPGTYYQPNGYDPMTEIVIENNVNY